MIEKECCKISLTELCEYWGVTCDDFDLYLDSADKAFDISYQQPLTLEELQKMDGEPVYVIWDSDIEPYIGSCWMLVGVPEERLNTDCEWVDFADLDETCKAYRQKPTEGEND